MNDVFDREYYLSHCGDEPYLQSSNVWKAFFRPIADAIVLGLRPRKVFDAGCAVGFLVEALWDRGVEAHGRDVSEFAISEVRADVRPWCEVGSIAASIKGEYDLVLCIEVVEHMPEDEALAAIGNITSIAPRVLFSSSPTDLVEKTHVNVRPVRYWLERFAEHGFAPAANFDATFLTPHAVLFERSESAVSEQAISSFAEIVRQRLLLWQARERHVKEMSAFRTKVGQDEEALRAELALLKDHQQQASAALDRTVSEKDAAVARYGEVEREFAHLRLKNSALSQTVADCEDRLVQSTRQADIATQQAASYDRQRQSVVNGVSAMRAAFHDESQARRLLQLKLSLLETSASWRILSFLRSKTASPSIRRALQAAWWSLTFRLGTKMRSHRAELAARRKIEGSGFFDADIYLSDNPEIANLRLDPLRHYMHQGWREGRRPSTRFDPKHYLAAYPDVATSGAEPLGHYLDVGRLEGREPLPSIDTSLQAVHDTGLFDVNYYFANYPDIAMAGIDPVLHFASFGWTEGRWPNAQFDTEYYLESNRDVRESGINPLVHYAKFGMDEGRLTQRLATPGHTLPAGSHVTGLKPARAHIAAFGANWSALPIFRDPRAPRTINIVTDSVDSHSLFGGVGTAIVVGALLAKLSQATLRLVTRTTPPDALALGRVLDVHKVDWQGPTDLIHIPHDGSASLPIGDRDIMLTTSWWTTRAVSQSVNASQIIYLLQEDERMFYPQGDMRLRCAEMLSDASIQKLVNTKLLFDHLLQGTEALASLDLKGQWFEPAFPAAIRPESLPEKQKLDFFFYARPTNDRNLFWRGLEVVEEAVQTGVLSPDRWNFHFVGRNIPELLLPGGIKPIISERLPWSDYASLVARMDLGLCPMYTPHPSYPPLDLAASGAVVVTNTCGIKHSLQQWSDNILTAAPDTESLCQALRQAVALVDDKPRRLQNCLNDRISRDWNATLNPVLTALLSKMAVI